MTGPSPAIDPQRPASPAIGPSTGKGHVLDQARERATSWAKQSKRSTNPLETAAASRTKDGDGD